MRGFEAGLQIHSRQNSCSSLYCVIQRNFSSIAKHCKLRSSHSDQMLSSCGYWLLGLDLCPGRLLPLCQWGDCIHSSLPRDSLFCPMSWLLAQPLLSVITSFHSDTSQFCRQLTWLTGLVKNTESELNFNTNGPSGQSDVYKSTEYTFWKAILGYFLLSSVYWG